MSVYVGNNYPCLPNPPFWRWGTVAHLFADTEVELDALAVRIGCKLSWKQKPRRSLTHYDLTPGMREKALRAGAVPADRHLEVEYIRAARAFSRAIREATDGRG